MPVFLIVEAEGLDPRPRNYSKVFYKLSLQFNEGGFASDGFGPFLLKALLADVSRSMTPVDL